MGATTWRLILRFAERLAVGSVVALALVGCSRDPDVLEPTGTPVISVESTTTSTTSTSTTIAVTTTTLGVPVTEPPTTIADTTTIAPTTEAPTTEAPTTTLASGACPAPAALPGGWVESASKLVDVDIDGVTDTVRTYSVNGAPVAGDWHLRVELAAGGGADLALPDDPAPGAAKILGGSYVGSNVEPGPGGLRPALFVTTGAGASASVVSLFRLDGCALVAMGTGSFAVGAGVTHGSNLRCEGVAGTSVLAYQDWALNADGLTFDVTDTGYTRTVNDLTVFGSGPQVTNLPAPPAVATLIDCPDVDHP